MIVVSSVVKGVVASASSCLSNSNFNMYLVNSAEEYPLFCCDWFWDWLRNIFNCTPLFWSASVDIENVWWLGFCVTVAIDESAECNEERGYL